MTHWFVDRIRGLDDRECIIDKVPLTDPVLAQQIDHSIDGASEQDPECCCLSGDYSLRGIAALALITCRRLSSQ